MKQVVRVKNVAGKYTLQVDLHEDDWLLIHTFSAPIGKECARRILKAADPVHSYIEETISGWIAETRESI